MPYGKMTWKVDIDSLKTVQSVEKFIELAHFKDPTAKILDTTGSLRLDILERFPELNYTIIMTDANAKEKDTSQFKNAKVVTADASTSLLDQGLQKAVYSVVVAQKDNANVFELSQMLSSNGKLLLESGDAVVVNQMSPPKNEENASKGTVQIVHREADTTMLERVQRYVSNMHHTSCRSLT